MAPSWPHKLVDFSSPVRDRVVVRLVLPIFFALWLLALPLTSACAADKKVLFMYADKSNGVMVAYREFLQTALRNGSPDPITFYEEYMDLWQNSGDDYMSLLRSYYTQKYKGQKFDLIFAQAPPVLTFLGKYGDEIFPKTPVVFGSVDKTRFETLKLTPKMTGVLTDLGFAQTLAVALRLQPDARRVVVVSGTSESDQAYLRNAQIKFREFDGRVEFIYLSNLPLAELEKRLASLPGQTIVLYTSLYRDGSGQTHVQMDSIARVSKASTAPTYSVIDRFIEAGSIGGFVVSMEADAKEVAKIGLRVLAGEKPENIPVHVGDTNRYIFHWRQLQKFGIKEQTLPAGSILLFKQPTFWEQYKWRIVVVITVLILQAGLIIALLVNRFRRRRAEAETKRFAAEIEAEHERLEEVVRNVPGIVWESRLDPAKGSLKTVFVSPYVKSMLGYEVEEWLAVPDFPTKIIHQDDRETFLRETKTILNGPGEGVLRFRGTAKDGRLLWVEAHVAAIKDENGQTVGLRGVTMDITERKRDEHVLQQLSGRLLTMRDEEQRRIAGELHDGLGQSLAIIKNRALMGMRDEASQIQMAEQLKEIVATANSSIAEVRSIAHNLRPFELDRLGLVAAIDSMLDLVSASTSIIISKDLDPVEGLLSNESETSVYRIIQEGLNNVVKHSNATNARVEIKKTLKQLTISVFDNGKGFTRSAPSENGNKVGGFGLAGVAERVRLLGGSLLIESQPGSGTTVTIRLELQNVVTT